MKAQISGRMASIVISDVVAVSVNSEKTRMKKCMMIMIIIIIIMNKSQETTVFGGCQKLTSAMKLLYQSVASYSPEARTFGTLITSTKVLSLVICNTL